MKRDIVTIDEEKCTGCGQCIPGCPEGALQVIDGKAVLVSDLLCDGLGACLGACPEGALTVEQREAEPYDETRVIAQMAPKGRNVVTAHLLHLREHGQTEYLKQAVGYLREHEGELAFPLGEVIAAIHASGGCAGAAVEGGCPGSRARSFAPGAPAAAAGAPRPSQLTQWPIQLHLVNPRSPHFRKADLLVAADCTAFGLAGFHEEFLRGRKLVIACPKLDDGQDAYVEKLAVLVKEAQINTITVMVMEVPCCAGLLHLVRKAVKQAGRTVPVKAVVVGIEGRVVSEEWVAVS